jgi:hypothetical protein
MFSVKLFSEKMIFSKIFFGVWLARKNYKMRKSKFGKCCQNPESKFGRILARSAQVLTMEGIWQYSGQFHSESGPLASGDGG